MLYPPHCFFQDILEEHKFLQLCLHQDDIWFWVMAVMKGYKINVVEGNYTDEDLISYLD